MRGLQLLPEHDERRRLALHFLSYITQRGLPVLATFLLARILGVEDFGFFIAALTTFSTLTLFADLGVSQAITTRIGRMIAVNRLGDAGALTIIASIASVAVGLLISLLLLLNLQPLEEAVYGNNAAWTHLVPGALYIPATALALVLTGALTGSRNYRSLAIVGASSGVLYVAIVVGFAFLAESEGALWGAALGVLVRALLCAFFVKRDFIGKEHRRTAIDVRSEGLQLAAIAIPASIAAFAWTPVNTYLIATMFRSPDGAVEVGVFGVTQQIFSIAMLFPGILTQFSLPRMAVISGDRARAQRKKIALQYAIYAGIAALAISSVALAFPKTVMSLFGAAYARHDNTLVLMLLAGVVSAPQGVFSNYMLAAGMNWMRVTTWIVWAFVVVAATAIEHDVTAYEAAHAYLIGWCSLTLLQGYCVLADRR